MITKNNNNHRTFTIRLSNDENTALSKLKKELDITTDNGVIRFLVSNYDKLNKLFLSEQKSRQNAEYKVASLESDFNDIRRVFKMVLNK